METQHMPLTGPLPKLGYSFAEAEVSTGLSRTSLYRLYWAGQLRTVSHGRRRIIPADEVARLMGMQQETAA